MINILAVTVLKENRSVGYLHCGSKLSSLEATLKIKVDPEMELVYQKETKI